jgi:hypothetical protein
MTINCLLGSTILIPNNLTEKAQVAALDNDYVQANSTITQVEQNYRKPVVDYNKCPSQTISFENQFKTIYLSNDDTNLNIQYLLKSFHQITKPTDSSNDYGNFTSDNKTCSLENANTRIED